MTETIRSIVEKTIDECLESYGIESYSETFNTEDICERLADAIFQVLGISEEEQKDVVKV